MDDLRWVEWNCRPGKWRGATTTWSRAADVQPARTSPPPPVTVGAQNVDGVTRPENLRSPSTGCLDTITENGLIRADRPDRPDVVDDLCRNGNRSAVGRRELTAGNIQFGAK